MIPLKYLLFDYLYIVFVSFVIPHLLVYFCTLLNAIIFRGITHGGNYEVSRCLFYIQDCFDAGFLRNMLQRNDSSLYTTYSDRSFIALFDFDKAGYDCWNPINGNLVESDPKKCLTKKINNKPNDNVYAMLLPVPNNSSIEKQVIKEVK